LAAEKAGLEIVVATTAQGGVIDILAPDGNVVFFDDVADATLAVRDGSSITLSNANLDTVDLGGTVSIAGNPSWTDVTVSGTTTIPGGVTVSAVSGLTVDGVLALAAGVGNANLSVFGGQTVGGTGEIFLSPENSGAGSGTNVLFLDAGAGSEPVALGPELTLRAGTGQIRTVDFDPATIEGQIVVEADGALDILRPLTLGDEASFVFRVDDPDTFGVATTNSTLALDGDLVLDFAADEGFAAGDRFELVSGGTLTSGFDTVSAPDLAAELQAIIDLQDDLLAIDLV
jgi:hypothetical protein